LWCVKYALKVVAKKKKNVGSRVDLRSHSEKNGGGWLRPSSAARTSTAQGVKEKKHPHGGGAPGGGGERGQQAGTAFVGGEQGGGESGGGKETKNLQLQTEGDFLTTNARVKGWESPRLGS